MPSNRSLGPRSLAVALTLVAAGAALSVRPAAACHTYDHAKHLQGIGIGVDPRVMEKLAHIPVEFDTIPSARLGATPCVGGMADIYECDNVDLLAYVPLADMGGGGAHGNDIWGWTDPETGTEWALMGLTTGTAFVSLEDPTNPLFVGFLPTETTESSWRDLKTYGNYVFIVSDHAQNYGIQVFDLTRLRDVTSPPVTFSTVTDLTAHYTGIGSAHNIAIDEETGFAYTVGNNSGGTTCSAGLHMVDIHDPANPTFAGCFSADGYTHDVECSVYHGPDTEHEGAEICYAFNEDTLTIVDVTNKSAPQQLSRTSYPGFGYTHQGWLAAGQRYMLIDDELDENPNPRFTYVWDLQDLDLPVLLGHYAATGVRAPAIDHNQFMVGDFSFQSNYKAGLSILHVDDASTASLSEVGYFDTYPESNTASFAGAWATTPSSPAAW